MKIMRIVYATVAFLLVSCTQTHQTTRTERTPEIQFGRTGGFTNIPVNYAIRKNREVFRLREETSEKINKISAGNLREIMALVDSLNFQNLGSGKAGNVNFYIRVMTPEYDHTVQWSESEQDTPIYVLYSKLLNTLKK